MKCEIWQCHFWPSECSNLNPLLNDLTAEGLQVHTFKTYSNVWNNIFGFGFFLIDRGFGLIIKNTHN